MKQVIRLYNSLHQGIIAVRDHFNLLLNIKPSYVFAKTVVLVHFFHPACTWLVVSSV